MSAGNRSFAARNKLVVAVPGLVNDATLATPWTPMTDSVRVVAGVLLGVTDIGVSAKLEQALDVSGGTPKDIPGAAIVPFTAIQDGTYATIDCEATALDEHNGYTYVRLLITVASGVAGGNVAGFLLLPTRHAPPAQPAAYAQQIEVAG
jgi:hypothetical protein